MTVCVWHMQVKQLIRQEFTYQSTMELGDDTYQMVRPTHIHIAHTATHSHAHSHSHTHGHAHTATHTAA